MDNFWANFLKRFFFFFLQTSGNCNLACLEACCPLLLITLEPSGYSYYEFKSPLSKGVDNTRYWNGRQDPTKVSKLYLSAENALSEVKTGAIIISNKS